MLVRSIVSAALLLLCSVPVFGQKDTVSIFVIGDIMCHRAQVVGAFNMYAKDHPGAVIDAGGECYDWSTSLLGIADEIRDADIAIGNIEFPFAGPPFSGYPTFSAPDSYLDYVTGAGFDLLLAANNHILDRGSSGLSRTIDLYDRMEADSIARYAGISADPASDSTHNPVIMQVGGLKLAFVNFTYGTNEPNPVRWPKVNYMQHDDIAVALERAADSDFTIVLPHWGIEYDTVHSGQQDSLATWMIERGADAIVGAHPHRVQDWEIRRLSAADSVSRFAADSAVFSGRSAAADSVIVPVFYSVGNAVSNQNDPEGRLELAVTLRIENGPDGARMLEPLWEWLWCTKPGMITDGYTVIRIADYLDRPEAWRRAPEDYDLMLATWRAVQAALSPSDPLCP